MGVRATRKKQRGGFYPSVYSGITGARILAPLIAKQLYMMFSNAKAKAKQKAKANRKTKKLPKNKRA
jgi:hypothetical protein